MRVLYYICLNYMMQKTFLLKKNRNNHTFITYYKIRQRLNLMNFYKIG